MYHCSCWKQGNVLDTDSDTEGRTDTVQQFLTTKKTKAYGELGQDQNQKISPNTGNQIQQGTGKPNNNNDKTRGYKTNTYNGTQNMRFKNHYIKSYPYIN